MGRKHASFYQNFRKMICLNGENLQIGWSWNYQRELILFEITFQLYVLFHHAVFHLPAWYKIAIFDFISTHRDYDNSITPLFHFVLHLENIL